jgi:ABC-type transport system involved in cytochrome bd biosynthesis fused ATPase/permease subunit
VCGGRPCRRPLRPTLGEMFLLTGASGSGKSTVRELIADGLAAEVECVELGHVARVLPVSTIAWRQQATDAAVRRALDLQSVGRHLLLAGDPVAAGEVIAAPSADKLHAIAVCLLDVNAEAQAARLAQRGDDPRLLAHHQAFAGGCAPTHRIQTTCPTFCPPTAGTRCDGNA